LFVNEHDDSKKSAAFAAGFSGAKLRVPAALLDIIMCLLLGAMGLWFFVQAGRLPAGRTMIGVGTFPMITSALLMVFCALQIALSLRRFKSSGTTTFDRPLAVPMGMALLLLFPVSMDSFGYFQTAAVWVPAFAWVAGVSEIPTIITLTIVVLLLARFVFQMLLGTPLP
jgi:hypothetical protein